jgi:tRNA-intron endonuclease
MSSAEAISSSTDFSFTVEGILFKKGTIIIQDKKSQDQLRNKGYGEMEISVYILKPYEALYLMHTNRLKAFKDKQPLGFDSLLRVALKFDKNILTKFLIYRDLRSRGYVAKEGFGFGVDFRVYDRGEFEKRAAKYVVFGINEGTNTGVRTLSKILQDINIMGKDAIVAVVERRGEVIYYKLDKMNLTENKNAKNQNFPKNEN